jgi:hypothetical protein
LTRDAHPPTSNTSADWQDSFPFHDVSDALAARIAFLDRHDAGINSDFDVWDLNLLLSRWMPA